MDWNWITSTGSDVLMVALSGLGIYATLILLTRITGLRSFSKMSGFDYAITVAMGSVVATTMLSADPPLLGGMTALLVLYGIQFTISKARRHSVVVERAVDNEPIVVMAGTEVLSEHLDHARLSVDDLRSRLRMAGVTHPDQVLAVVLETTGDVSVLKNGSKVDPWVFEGVRGAEHLLTSGRVS